MESNDTLVIKDQLRKNDLIANNPKFVTGVDLSQLSRFRFSDYVNKCGIAIKPIIFKHIDISTVSDAIDSVIMYRVLYDICLTQQYIPDTRYFVHLIETINGTFDLNLIPDSNDCKLMLDYVNELVNEYSNINIPEHEGFVNLITTFGDGYCNITLFVVGK